MSAQFNLIDEAWIPMVNHGLVSLRDIFSPNDFRTLGGNPIQKIAVFKLLMAIAQAACTPRDEVEWREIQPADLARSCLDYLDQWHDQFFLYGDKPFLQMPMVASARLQNFGAVLPEVSTGNTTVLSEIQIERPLNNAQKALLLLSLMGFALAGKKTDNSVILSPGYGGKSNDKGRPSSSRAGPSVGFMGYLHSFIEGQTIGQTLWINLHTQQSITEQPGYAAGLGVAPWEEMPKGEDCAAARKLKESLMGRLLPLCRFVLLTESGLHYSEGLAHMDYKDGVIDPSAAADFTAKKPKALWANPEKRPWRELSALLSFLSEGKSHGYDCVQLRIAISRICHTRQTMRIWSGGLRVSSNAGEQFASGNDDFVASQILIEGDMLGELWFDQLKLEMEGLDQLSRSLYGCVIAYFKQLKADGAKLATQATHIYWQLCEKDFQALVDACPQIESARDQRSRLRKRFSAYARQAYDSVCPKDTARQLDAWAKCRPNHKKYLKPED